jgi:hypothetical protein
LNILLFASVGILLGAVLCFGMLATFHDDPRAALVIFWVPGEAMSAAFYFGGAPAVVTGLVAALLRYYVQRLQVLAIVMAPIGAVIAGIYVALIGVRSGGYPLIGMLSLAGGVSAFCSTLLPGCRRPWTIFDRRSAGIGTSERGRDA